MSAKGVLLCLITRSMVALSLSAGKRVLSAVKGWSFTLSIVLL